MKPSYIMIHHTAVSYDKNKDQFKANDNYHRSQWNFKSSMGFYLGYNYEIAKNGKVRQARQDGETTAACYQSRMNDGRCIHIAIDGNFDIEKPAPTQIFALRDLMKQLVAKYSIEKKNIVLHKDYATKSCPGMNVDINFIRSMIYPEAVKEVEKTVPTLDTKEQIIKLMQDLLALVKKL